MARLDIRRTKSLHGLSLVMELQTELLVDLDTVIIAPLVDTRRLPPLEEINPLLLVDGHQLALRLEQLVSFPKDRLGAVVGNALADEYRIMKALDRLLSRT